MIDTDHEMDELGKQLLAPLRSTPDLDPQAAAELKQAYILQVEALSKQPVLSGAEGSTRQSKDRAGLFGVLLARPVLKVLVAGLFAMAILLIGSGISVSAAQDSLPGQALYPVKTWTEDLNLALTFSRQTRLNLVLNYTNRRMSEISNLLAHGKPLDEKTSLRFQQELDDALQLAAQLDDTQIQSALLQIKDHAASQGLIVKQMISGLPPRALPAIQQLENRLDEQVQISTIGEGNPQEFRTKVRERQMQRKENKHPGQTEEPGLIPPGKSGTPAPGQQKKDSENNLDQPTSTPSQDGKDNGQGQPGNGNHGNNPTHTPKP